MSAALKESANPLFDKRLIAAFVDGVVKVMKTMANTETQVGKPFIESNFTVKGDIAGMVGMVAPPLKGTLMISYKQESILAILENMLGEKHEEISQEVVDAVGELTNMIYGTAKATLNQLGYNFEMAIPSVIRGDFVITKSEKGATLVIPFNLPGGKVFHVEITVQQ